MTTTGATLIFGFLNTTFVVLAWLKLLGEDITVKGMLLGWGIAMFALAAFWIVSGQQPTFSIGVLLTLATLNIVAVGIINLFQLFEGRRTK